MNISVTQDAKSKCMEMTMFCLSKCNNDDVFWDLETNAEKIKYCCEIIEKNNLFPQKDVETPTKKSENKSTELRQEGNFYFATKNYMDALDAYNEALCFANPVESESMGLIYANRSVIYLDTGFFGLCLENIQLALDHNYPERLKPKLLERKKICLERMKVTKDSADTYGNPITPKLSYPANPKMPFMINDLKFARNRKFGRHIVTKRDLKPGDIVHVEEPFVKNSYNFFCQQRCYNCGQHNFLNLHPCPKSTKVMFCSEKCANEAWERHYKFESPVIDKLFYWVPKHFAIRTTLKAFTMMKDPAELADFIDSIDVDTENAFNLDFSRANERDKFRIAYTLCTNEAIREIEYQFVYLVTCAIIYYLMKDVPELKKVLQTPSIENLFLELLLHFQMVGDNNSFGLDPAHRRGQLNIEAGSYAVSLAQSLVNHSCSPNIQFAILNEKPCLIVARPISAGEQIFINYKDLSFESKSLFERKRILAMGYQLNPCTCPACIKKYPQNPQQKGLLKQAEYVQLQLFMDSDITQEKAKEMKEFASKKLIRMDRYIPCEEVLLLRQCLFHAVRALHLEVKLEQMLTPK